ncbi:MAG: hypothetical protein RIS47_1932 [Bacteroidota bacterium]
MQILHYNELNYSSVAAKMKKVEAMLAKGDFQSADVKRMANSDFYRAKLDATNRLLFKFAKFNGTKYILLLEVILNHAYEKSKFLRGKEIFQEDIIFVNDESSVPETDITPLTYVHPKRKKIHILEKFISFDDIQSEIFELPSPLIIIGSAGSGKTMLTLEKLKTLHGNVAYLSLSRYLVENAQKLYFANGYENEHQEVDFLSFTELIQSIRIPSGEEIHYKQFEALFIKNLTNSKLKEPFKLFEEFKGVLTGSVTQSAYLKEDEYLNLGVRQSIYSVSERKEVYAAFTRYLKFLEESAYYDLNLLSYEYTQLVTPQYDYVVIDEVQDITNVQLKFVLSTLKKTGNFILTGDSNQIVHPNFFSWSNIKSMFFLENQTVDSVRILHTNYRNSHEVTTTSNLLLKLKNARFGSIDKESTYLIDTISTNSGQITLLNDNVKIKTELNNKTHKSAKYAILVMNNADKKYAQSTFKTPLIFSIQEAKGLEYENIILLNFVSDYNDEFYEITKGVDEADLESELRYARARDKTDKDLEVYKFFINSLYVAFTRAVKNLIVIESRQNHRIFELLKLKERKENLTIQAEQSNNDEWLEEARKLELQGKHEQAREIRARILGIEYLSPEELAELKAVALNPNLAEKDVKRERKLLFRWAESNFDISSIDGLAKLNFLRAVEYMKEFRKIQKEFTKDCRLNRTNSLTNATKRFGINFRTLEDDRTGLMLAAHFGAETVVEYCLNYNADLSLTDILGLNALQLAFRSAWYSMRGLAKVGECVPMSRLHFYWSRLAQPALRINTGDRIIKIGSHSMEYFLLTYLRSVHDKLLESDNTGFRVDDILAFTDKVPTSLLADYRRRRNYVSSILSKNEVERNTDYSKPLFKRVIRGVYVINPELSWEIS